MFITIEDINDNTPIFRNTPYQTEISEVRKQAYRPEKMTNLLGIYPASKQNAKKFVSVKMTTNKCPNCQK